jgi:hypothetical protein
MTTPSFSMTRLDPPTGREVEEQVAEYIEESLALCDGRELGPRTRRDGASGLRVDFTYDGTMPAVAIEITSLVVPSIRALGSELVKLESELREIVCSEDLGCWLLGIRAGSDVRRLKASLLRLLRAHGGRGGHALFSAKETPDGLSDADLPLIAELLDAGLVSAALMGEGNALSIFPPIGDEAIGVRGFSTLLRNTIAANIDKLREARPRQTHLVVTLERSDVSADPADTPPPQLPEGIDVLWLLPGYYNAKWTYRVWRTIAGDQRWHLLRHPLGEPSSVCLPPITTS